MAANWIASYSCIQSPMLPILYSDQQNNVTNYMQVRKYFPQTAKGTIDELLGYYLSNQ